MHRPRLPAVWPYRPRLVLQTGLIGPAASHATFFEGATPCRFETPVTVGLRPGYVYQFKLSGFDAIPRKPPPIPTLEVLGSLMLPPPLRVSSFPVPVLFTPDDIDLVLAGVFITKIVYLENPEKAVPLQTRPELPPVSEVKNEKELALAERGTRAGRWSSFGSANGNGRRRNWP